MHFDKIDLAHEADFVVGRLTVRPSRRELVRDDGVSAVIEHRVMQVLIALAKAGGGIVTREELAQACWSGRVVGDDAINRVLSRLRKTAAGIGANSFEVETLNRIGYRMSSAHHEAPQPGNGGTTTSKIPWPTRRIFALGTAAACVLTVGGGAVLYRGLTLSTVPSEVRALMVEADQALNQATGEGNSQAIGLYRRVVTLAPEFSDGWGLLGFAYATRSHYVPSSQSEAMRQRAEAAGRRALELDRRNANGELALATALPLVGHWREKELGLERALVAGPKNYNARRSLAEHLNEVGRIEEALEQFGRIEAMRCPIGHHGLVAALWSAGRIEEAERAMDDAASLYPTHPALWHQRYNLHVFGGRPNAALAMTSDVEEHPTDLADRLLADFRTSAGAIESRDPTAIDSVARDWMRTAREDAGASVIAIRMLSALGRVNEAFEVAEAYHVGRSFAVSTEIDFDHGWADIPLEQRGTSHLFEPVTGPMRADPRFERLVEEIGLTRYWHEMAIQPDYRRA